MPTYQYVCTACADALEVQQSFTDDALTVCPACEGRLRKVFNAVGVVFKGSGFYRNDSREADKAAKSAGANGSGTKSDGADSGTKSDSGTSETSKSDAGKSETAAKSDSGGTSSTSDGSSSSSNGSSGTPARSGAGSPG